MTVKLSNGKKINLIPIIAIVLILAVGITSVLIKKNDKEVYDVAAKRDAVETIGDLIYVGDEGVALADSIDGSSNTLSIASAAFVKINDERKKANLKPLTWSDALAKSSAIRAREVYKVWSHNRPDGTEYWSVDPALVYGETLSKGYRTADDAVTAWMNSQAHRETLLDPGFRTISISIYEAEDGNWYWTALLGY